MSDQANQPSFSIQRIYLKDLSLELPNAPQILLEMAENRGEIAEAVDNKVVELAKRGIRSLAVACTKDLPQQAAPNVVVARFDPGSNPAVVPLPNDLATGSNGLLHVTPPAGASGADLEFVGYLNTLDGFPADTPASVTVPVASPLTTAASFAPLMVTVTDCSVPSAVFTVTVSVRWSPAFSA